jgi:hypothetical protein
MRLIVLAAVAASAALLAGVVLYRSLGNSGNPPTGWAVYRDYHRWRLSHPRAWRAQRVFIQCRVGMEGVLLTNAARGLEPICGNFDVSDAGASLVAVAFTTLEGGPDVTGTEPPTALPLSLASMPLVRVDTRQLMRHRIVLARGGRYILRAWIGRRASQADRVALRRVVASIRFPPAWR